MKTPVSVAEQTLQIGILGADLVYLLYYVGVGGWAPSPLSVDPQAPIFFNTWGKVQPRRCNQYNAPKTRTKWLTRENIGIVDDDKNIIFIFIFLFKFVRARGAHPGTDHQVSYIYVTG